MFVVIFILSFCHHFIIIIIEVYCQTKDLRIKTQATYTERHKEKKKTSYNVKLNVDINIKLIKGTN